MGKQIALGTVVGAVVIFIVSSIWHIVLPFSETGFHMLPHEDILSTAMRMDMSETGIYMFPGMDPAKRSDPVEAQKFAEKFRRGPTGLIIFRPGGTEFSFPRLLVNQFCFQLMAAFVLSLLLAMSATALPGYLQRVFFVALVAVLPSLLIDLPYWNWYGFALAAVVKPRTA